jgi:DNA-binding transcriptional ArsR family regulator
VEVDVGVNLWIRQVDALDLPEFHPNVLANSQLIYRKVGSLTEARYGMSIAVRRILWWVVAGNRGGANRARIILAIKNQPINANQLAQRLGMDYKTVRHHLSVLLKNRLILVVGEGYGSLYFLSPELEQNYEEFAKIWEKIGAK